MKKKTGNKINRRYKDRLFYALFGSEERKRLTLELYNAINQTDYDNPDDLQINTIEDVVYMGMKNDVSFLLASDEDYGLFCSTCPASGKHRSGSQDAAFQ